MTTATASASTVVEEQVPSSAMVPQPQVSQSPVVSDAPIKLNASAIEKLRALFGESELGKMGKLDLERAITRFNEQVLGAEENKAEKQGALIATLAEYIRRCKPSYKDISALILTTDAKHAIATRRRVFQVAKGLPEVSIREGVNPYRQHATRYVKLAKWTNGDFAKGEETVDHVEINSVAYFTPVDALMAGFSMHCVLNAWKWATTPRNAGLRLSEYKSRPTADVAKERAGSLTVPVRKVNPKDKTQENRVMVPVVSNVDAIYGTVLGFLESMESKGDQQFTTIQGEALVALIDSLTVGHEPDGTEPSN